MHFPFEVTISLNPHIKPSNTLKKALATVQTEFDKHGDSLIISTSGASDPHHGILSISGDVFNMGISEIRTAGDGTHTLSFLTFMPRLYTF